MCLHRNKMEDVISKIKKLSHKQFRALLKKFRRKKKRQILAKANEERELKEQKERENAPGYKEAEAERKRNAELLEQFKERESAILHKLWMKREAEAQADFQRKKQLQEQEKIKREEERKRILAEIEEKQLLENSVKEQSKKDKQKKEEALQEALSSLSQGGEPWHNPLAPENYSVAAQERELCQFFLKTGCCRFGDRCSRGHPHPSVSCTLLIKNMYSHFSIGQVERDDYDTDIALEFEDSETYHDFETFYFDVLPEFQKFGRVVQFKVCSNHELHLRGNVYVQYSREKSAVEAYKAFNGRFYAGKQLTCAFSSVIKWKSAICGLYHRNRCPKGNNCNFLHVFRNPGNAFWAADKDYTTHSWDNGSYREKHNHLPYHQRDDSYSRKLQHSKRRRHYSDSDDYDDVSSSRSYRHKTPDRENRSYHKEGSHKRRSRVHSPPRSPSHSPTFHSLESDEDKYHRKHKHKKGKSRKSSRHKRSHSCTSD